MKICALIQLCLLHTYVKAVCYVRISWRADYTLLYSTCVYTLHYATHAE
jgi:hypothetical protein